MKPETLERELSVIGMAAKSVQKLNDIGRIILLYNNGKDPRECMEQIQDIFKEVNK